MLAILRGECFSVTEYLTVSTSCPYLPFSEIKKTRSYNLVLCSIIRKSRAYRRKTSLVCSTSRLICSTNAATESYFNSSRRRAANSNCRTSP